MKTISVKDVAGALNLTPRAVIYRLEKGQLKGTQQPNAFGKQEWRVYPTKEILEGLRRKETVGTPVETYDPSLNFSPGADEDVIDAVTSENDSVDQEQAQDEWKNLAKDTLRGLAEELVRPLTETILRQQELLSEKDKIIAEKEQQLRLLPDLQKQAEDERKAAELKALEAEAYQKQIAAMQVEKEDATAAMAKVAELEKAMEALKEDAAKVGQLQAELQQLKRPKPTFWQRLFMAGGEQS